jgi:DNA-binding NtrC family response regulator
MDTRRTHLYPSKGGRTLLMIHSERWMPELLRRAVQPLGIRVLGASDGATGLALFHAHASEVGLVLLGRTLPIVSSISVLDAIQQHAPMLPVILITGLPPFSVSHEYAGYRLADILQTPFELRAMSDLIQRTLSGEEVSAIGI